MMNQNIRRLLDRLNLFRRLSNVEVAQLTILKQSDDSLKRMASIMDAFKERTTDIDGVLSRMEEKMSEVKKRADSIERFELRLNNTISQLLINHDLDLRADLDVI